MKQTYFCLKYRDKYNYMIKNNIRSNTFKIQLISIIVGFVFLELHAELPLTIIRVIIIIIVIIITFIFIIIRLISNASIDYKQ